MSQNYCRQFAKDGNCKYGERCRFEHIQVEEVESPAVAARTGGGNHRARRPRTKRRPSQPRPNTDAQQNAEVGTATEQETDATPVQRGPIDEFFARYPEFSYNRTRPARREYSRLMRFMELNRGPKREMDEEERMKEDEKREKRDEIYKIYRIAFTEQFNTTFGTDAKDLKNWQNFCSVIGISPIPKNLKSCKAAVRRTFVNLVDVTDASRTGAAVQHFPNEPALSRYTISTGKVFPKAEAHAGGLLKHLLRHILNPRRRRPNGGNERASQPPGQT